MEQFGALAPSLAAPPADIMAIMGYAEFASILLVVSGACPPLFNLIGALQYFTPVLLVGEGVLKAKPMLIFLLLLHVAPAAFLLDDAFFSTGNYKEAKAKAAELQAKKDKRAANKKKYK